VIGGEIRGEQCLEQALDLTQADPGGEGDGGDFSEFGRVADDRVVGSSGQGGELIAEPLILGQERGMSRLTGGRIESPLEHSSMLVNGLATATGPLGLSSDGVIGPGEDGGGVADPGA
jgi:hypothetical protein